MDGLPSNRKAASVAATPPRAAATEAAGGVPHSNTVETSTAKKLTVEPNYSVDDDEPKQAEEFEGDIDGFEEDDFCKKTAKACASAGEVSGALYGTAFAFAFINLVLHVMRFMEDNMTKCYIAGGLELLTLIFMAVGTSSFRSDCTNLAMKDLDDFYNSLVAALTVADYTDDLFTDDVEKKAGIDFSAKWYRDPGPVEVCGIVAASISFVLMTCVVCSRPKEDVPPVQNITIINAPAAPGALASQDAQNEPAMEMHQFYGVNPLAGQQMPPQQYPQGYPGQSAPYPVNYPASMSPGMPNNRSSKSSKKSKKSSSQ